MAYTHVIFDLDGTLLNTLDDLAAAGNHVCETRGWPTFTRDQYRYKVGNGQPKLIERIIPAEYAGDGRIFEQVLREFRAYYDAHKEDHTAPYPGIVGTLDRLRAAGVKLAVLSNKDHAAAVPLVRRYFGERFSLVQGRIDAYPPKPAPSLTRYALDQLGIDATQALYVGDSNVDVATGHNVGIAVAGATWGFRGRAELEAAGADYLIEQPGDLASLIL